MADHVEFDGVVVEVSRDKFKIQIEKTESQILAQLSGKMRTNKIRVGLHDRVKVKVSPYDMSHGIIVSRE
jgi:translation initiation factor IF-1